MLASLVNINKYYNGVQVLRDVSLTIEDDSRIGLIGVNGCGKTTLLRILTGSELPDRTTERDGIVNISAKTSVGFLRQNAMLDCDGTVLEEMRRVFAETLAMAERMRKLEKKMSVADDAELDSLSAEYAELRIAFEAADGYAIDVKINTILNGMGFTPEDRQRDIQSFSGGEKTRLAVARLLLEQPNLLILDEPTNHLDFKTVEWLEDYLMQYRGALLIVSHDRFFLDRVVNNICDLERGRLTQYKGNYTTYIALKKEADARQQKEYDAQQKEIAKLEDYVARNLVRASTSKAAKSRRTKLEKMELVEKPTAPPKHIALSFTQRIATPLDVLSVKGLELAVGEGENRRILASDIAFSLRRADRLAIIGTNGTGKSTLLKALLRHHPAAGRIMWCDNVKLSYFDQESARLNPMNSAIEELHDHYPAMTELELRNRLARVRLTGEDVFKQVRSLSGGERVKLCLAIIIEEHANVLVLDEPTNHLDLSAKEMLEEALLAYEGTIIFVSHDRYLLKRLSTKLLELENGEAQLFECSFEEYLRRKAELRHQELVAREQQAIKAQLAKQSGVKTKQQRSEEAARRNRLRELENLLDETEKSIKQLEEALATEEVFSDYALLNEKCAELESAKKLHNELFDEWAELSE